MTRKKLNKFHKTLIVLLLMIASHLYESYLFFSVLLGLITFYKIKVDVSYLNKIFNFICLVIIIYGFSIALESYMYPRDPTNAGQFSNSLMIMLTEAKNLWIMFGIFILSLIIFKYRMKKWILFLLFIVVFIAMFEFPQYMEIKLSYAGRTLLTIIPFFLGFFFFLIILYEKRLSHIIDILYPRIENSLVYVAVFFFALQIAITFQWYGYTQIFKTVLTNNYQKSVIDYRQTILGENFYSNQMIRGFGWGWTYPFMSYALSKDSVWTVIENKDQYGNMSNPYSLITKIAANETISLKSKRIQFVNWNSDEKNIMSSMGNIGIIKFHMKESQSISGILKLNIGILEKQEFKVTINEHYIGSQIVNTEDTNITFKFDKKYLIKNDRNTIKFEFLNIYKTNNKNKLYKTLGLKSFRIE